MLYRSTRVGANGEAFTLYKLRTMRVDADRDGVDTTAIDDPRVLKVGALLRRLKVDEIPQVLNILNGSMAVIGPRPNVPREVERYTERERSLLAVRPGLTDLASVELCDLGRLIDGLGDPNAAYEQHIRHAKAALSLYHIDHRSLLFDLRVVGLSAIAVVAPRAATQHVRRWLQRSGTDEISSHIEYVESLRHR